MRPIAALFTALLLIQGCSYAISPTVADKADRSIPFEKIQADPDSYKGKLVILGGTVAMTSAAKQGTLIEVIERKLDYWGKPIRTNRTAGRFLVFVPRYLDALVFAPGRVITVAAEVEGTRSKALGELEYSYPVLFSKELKLWEQERASWNKLEWMDPLNDPDKK